MPKPTAAELQEWADKPIRLACVDCDRDDCDGVAEIPAGWVDVSEVSSLAEALTTYEEGDGEPPEGYSVLDWYTHLGWCPDCR